MTTSPLRRFGVAALIVGTLVACASEPAGESAGGDDAAAVMDVTDVPAPDRAVPRVGVELVDADWRQVAGWIRRETEAGRPVVVNVFASWCAPCKRELPLLVQAAEQHPDITFLGIDSEDQRAAAQALVREFEVPFTTLYDPDGQTAAALGARVMPTTVAFDRDGRLAARVIGEVSRTRLKDLLAALS